MTSLTVGIGQEFSTIHDAVAASHDGDTIYVQAGNYVDDYSIINNKISIIGVGGMVHLVDTGTIPNGKGIFVVNNDLTIDHLEFSGAKVPDMNGAGIRYQAGNLTVTNSYFHDNQDGILATPDAAHYGTGSITIDHSEFDHNGAGDGYSHNLYIGKVGTFTLTNSYVHDVLAGHEVKSRALNTDIENSRIIDGTGTASYSIDIPSRGNAIIKNNYIEQDARSVNNMMIRYGEEHQPQQPQWTQSLLLIEGNTIVSKGVKNPIGIVNGAADMTAQMVNNQIYGMTAAQLTQGVGPTSQSGDSTLSSAPIADTSHPWVASAWADVISGSAAANILTGTAGHDLFVGNSGSDTFVIQAGGSSDTITGFNSPGLHDVVRLEGYGFTDFAGVQAAMTQQGADVVLHLAKGDTLTFLNEQISDFSASDFAFPQPNGLSNVTGLKGYTLADIARPDPFTLPTSHGTSGTIKADATGHGVGTTGNDYMTDGGGAATMQGGAGDDTYVVNNAKDSIVENPGEGTDTANVGIANYVLPDNVENMMLSLKAGSSVTGNALDNRIAEKAGNDTIDGGAGNDLIWAGTGASMLTGGAGNDMFVFPTVGGLNTITDFHIGQDLISFSSMMNTAHYNGTDPLADHVMSIASDGVGGTIISVDPTHSGTMHAVVDVQGVTPEMLYVGHDILFA